MTQDIYCIIGPTGIGKSAYAIELATTLNAEIISADAYQVYRHMDIGTAKPNAAELKAAPHHLIDIKDPTEAYSLGDFLSLSKQLITDIRQKNKPVIICGGTALFIHAFLYSYSLPNAQSDPDIRQDLLDQYDEYGKDYLWNKLQNIDPVSAASIHPNNKHHLLRALEIYAISKQKPSDIKQRSQTQRSDSKIIGLRSTKEVVHQRIDLRVKKMINDGFIDEVNDLRKRGVPSTAQSFKALGYLQVLDFIKGNINTKEMVECIQNLTKKFSKRQMTWFKKIENVNWQEI